MTEATIPAGTLLRDEKGNVVCTIAVDMPSTGRMFAANFTDWQEPWPPIVSGGPISPEFYEILRAEFVARGFKG